MEFPVQNSLNAAREIAASANDQIRMLDRGSCGQPDAALTFRGPVAWVAAAPATIREFSAACYYFARDLQKSVHVPLGLIHSLLGRFAHRTVDERDGAAQHRRL